MIGLVAKSVFLYLEDQIGEVHHVDQRVSIALKNTIWYEGTIKKLWLKFEKSIVKTVREDILKKQRIALYIEDQSFEVHHGDPSGLIVL